MRKAALALALVCFPCVGAEEAPRWLTELASRTAPNYDSDVRAVVLLHEKTATVSPDGKVTTSVRKAVKILTRDGQREARAAVVYRTDSGRVRSLRAWTVYPSGVSKSYRKRDVIDAALVAGDVYNESRTAVILGSSDVDPGAVFGYESVLEDRSMFTQFSFQFQDDLPALTSRFSLQLPAGWSAESVTQNHERIEPLVNGSFYSWQLQHLPPVWEEPARPELTSIVPRVNVSYYPLTRSEAVGPTFQDWGEVSAWIASVTDPQVEPDRSVTTKAKNLVDGKESDFERIKAIAEFAQGIKYVSIQIGVGRGGGYKPHTASSVLEKAYGDCKDKVNLMRSMLSTVGIESYPVAIYAGDRRYVRPDWPSPHQFNHEIIAVKVSDDLEAPGIAAAGELGKLLFFDPTDSYTPVGYLPDHEQNSLALLITASGGELLRAPAAPPETNFLKRDIKIKLAQDGSIEGQIREYGEGSSASENRRSHKKLTRADYRKGIERWIARGAPSSSVSRIEAGDLENGGFFLEVDFSAARYGRTIGGHLLVFKPFVVLHRNFTYLTEKERRYAVVLEADAYEEAVEIEIPARFSVDEMWTPVAITTEFGSYAAQWRAEGGRLFVSRRLELHDSVIPSEDYTSVKDFFDRIHAAEQAPVVLARH